MLKVHCGIVVVAIVLALIGDSWAQSQQQSPSGAILNQQPQTQAQHTEQPPTSDQRGTEQSPAFIKIVPSPKTNAEAAQEAADHEEKVNSDKWLIRWTAAVAAFTLVLAAVGAWQGIQLKRSVDLARNEYDASHRPHLIVRDIFIEGRNIIYLLVNKGETPARIVESWIMAEFVPMGQPLRPLRSFGHDDLGQITLAAGEVRDITYPMPSAISFPMMFPETRRIGIEGRPPVHGETFFTGTIVYEDGNGRRRRTVFRRQWNQSPGSVGAFNRVGDPDQEYAD